MQFQSDPIDESALSAARKSLISRADEFLMMDRRWCYGKTPMQTFLDSVPLAKEKMLAAS